MKNNIEVWIELIQSSGYTLSELGFSAGASNEEIERIEAVTKQVIPNKLKQFLSYINGQYTLDFYFLPDQVRLFSCQEIIDEWQQEQADAEEYAEDTAAYYYEFQDNDKIRCTIFHKTRIPFAGQEGFGVVCIDNDPGPNGTPGQIIYLITECDFVVLADSFDAFINLYIDSMQRGILKFEKEKAGYSNTFRLKSKAAAMNGEAFLEAFAR